MKLILLILTLFILATNPLSAYAQCSMEKQHHSMADESDMTPDCHEQQSESGTSNLCECEHCTARLTVVDFGLFNALVNQNVISFNIRHYQYTSPFSQFRPPRSFS